MSDSRLRKAMILRQKCDEEGSDFSDRGRNHEIYVCARKMEDERIELFEQIDGIEKEGVHDINRKVVVTEDFIRNLSDRL